MQLYLFKDSDCDLCKLQQSVFFLNPPKANITIIHCKHSYGKELANKMNITSYPTTILYDKNIEVTRFIGFIDSLNIDKIIEEYETKYLV